MIKGYRPAGYLPSETNAIIIQKSNDIRFSYKETDSVYLQKRNIPKEYNPVAAYDFHSWRDRFDNHIRSIYEHLHEILLYTDEKQDFDKAVKIFETISNTLSAINE